MEGPSQLHRVCEIEHDMGVFLLYSSVSGGKKAHCVLLQAQ